MWLTDDELAYGAAHQEYEWNVRECADKCTRANAPGILAEAEGVADHREGVAMNSMVPRPSPVDTDPRRTV